VDSAEVRTDARGSLDSVATLLAAHPELTRVRIEGHADDRGDPHHNRVLSTDRALRVRDYLVGKGIAADRLETIGWGTTRPLELDSTEEARAKNRRVAFVITGGPGAVVEENAAPAPPAPGKLKRPRGHKSRQSLEQGAQKPEPGAAKRKRPKR
jgi:hypothetical protein